MSLDSLTYLLATGVTFLIAAAYPGPATLAVAATSMAQGCRSGQVPGAGMSVGLALWRMDTP